MSNSIAPPKVPPAVLSLLGSARLTIDGAPVKLRLKGLALLYYLALEGPTRREHLAHLLWGHGRALQNLRVELHRLRVTLQEHGLEPLEAAADPLQLHGVTLNASDDNVVTSGRNEMLLGLDDVSPEYQAWLELRRALGPGEQMPRARPEVVDALAREVTPPYLILLAGEPGTGKRQLAQDLAAELGLPFLESAASTGPALRYLKVAGNGEADLVSTIETDTESVWVLPRSSFGEDDDTILRLRASYPAAHMRYHQLGPLEWRHAKQLMPEGSSFFERAELYLAACGNHQYLTELVKLRTKLQPGAPIPVPQRMRAAYALEARKLSEPARHALETVSVQPGPLTYELLMAAGVSAHIDELERQGWLRFDAGHWHYSSELARRMLEAQLPEGTRRRLLTEAAHLNMSASARAPSDDSTSSEPYLEYAHLLNDSSTRQVVVGAELWLDELISFGPGVNAEADRICYSSFSSSGGHHGVKWFVDAEMALLNVRGRTVLGNSRARRGAQELPTLKLTASPEHQRFAVKLPLQNELDVWVLAPSARWFGLEFPDESMVVELKINAYEARLATPGRPAPDAVTAYVLGADSPSPTKQRPSAPLREPVSPGT